VMQNTTFISFDTLMAEMRRLTSIVGFLFLFFLSSLSSLCSRWFRPLLFCECHVADTLTAHPTLAVCRSPHITNVTSLNATDTTPHLPQKHTTLYNPAQRQHT